MFDVHKSYPFTYEGDSKTYEGWECRREIYTFINRDGHTYIVWADEFEEANLYGVKFFRRDYYDLRDQFSVVLNTYDAFRVLATCLNIMLSIYKRQPNVSFIFQGANSSGESEAETKRFRIYSFMMENLFSPASFDRFAYPHKSVYLLRNRKADPNVLPTIDDVLKHHGIVF
jgi:hypothetical protein